MTDLVCESEIKGSRIGYLEQFTVTKQRGDKKNKVKDTMTNYKYTGRQTWCISSEGRHGTGVGGNYPFGFDGGSV